VSAVLDYNILFDGIIREMVMEYGLTHFQAVNYVWTVAARGVMAAHSGYEKLEH